MLQSARQVIFVLTMAVLFASVLRHSFGKEIVPVDTVIKSIEKSQLPQKVKNALKSTVAKNLDTDKWVCEVDNIVGVAVAVKLTDKAKRTSISSAQARAFAEVVFFVIQKGIYEKNGFTDAELLKDTLLNKDGVLRYSGSVQSMLHNTETLDGFAITTAYVSLKTITAELLKPACITELGKNYSEAGRQRIVNAAKTKDWKAADRIWEHLKERQLLSPQLVIAYGTCLAEQKQTERTVKHFAEYIDGYSGLKNENFFLQIGEILEPLAENNKDAERIALKAFAEAERLILRKEKTIELPKQQPPNQEQ
jgi:hypothetical protein